MRKKTLGMDDSLRCAVEKALEEYMSSFHETYGKYIVVWRDDTLTIGIHSNRANNANYWSGFWAVCSTLKANDSGGMDMVMNLEAQVHYYEDGNVQSNSTHDAKSEIKKGSDEEMAKSIVTALNNFERGYHTGFMEDNKQVMDKTMKLLRRQLPITRQKIKWNKLATYTIGKETGKE